MRVPRDLSLTPPHLLPRGDLPIVLLLGAVLLVDDTQPLTQIDGTTRLLREGLLCATQGACDRHARAGRN